MCDADKPLAPCHSVSPRCIDSDWMTHFDSDLNPVGKFKTHKKKAVLKKKKKSKVQLIYM